MTPLVSVLMRVFNHEQFVVEAVTSALAQVADFPVEILIGEDCSADHSRNLVLDLAARHPGRIRTVLPQANIGRHRMLAELYHDCRGRYIAILDGDDYWTNPHKLAQQAAFFEQHPDCVLCFHDAVAVWDDGRPPTPYNIKVRQPLFTLADYLAGLAFVPTSSVMLRAGLVPAMPRWFYHAALADMSLFVMTAQHGTIGYIDQSMAAYRRHDASIWSGSGDTWSPEVAVKRYTGLISLYEQFQEHLPAEYHPVLRARIAEHCYDVLWPSQQTGNWPLLRRSLWKALRLQPRAPISWRALASATLAAASPKLYTILRRQRNRPKATPPSL